MMGTIVCIDDETQLCNLLGLILETTGAPVKTFTNPVAALAFIQAENVAVICCDYRMPELSGIEVLERLKHPVPFIMMSGDLEIERVVRGEERIIAVLAKPFPPADLLKLVNQILGGE
jgi:two-component system C4-dicarboxylate transport response regulator DctD